MSEIKFSSSRAKNSKVMASGLDIYKALHRVARNVTGQDTVTINTCDRLDLLKLSDKDLLSYGFSESNIEQLVPELFRGDIRGIERVLGIQIRISADAPSILDGIG